MASPMMSIPEILSKVKNMLCVAWTKPTNAKAAFSLCRAHTFSPSLHAIRVLAGSSQISGCWVASGSSSKEWYLEPQVRIGGMGMLALSFIVAGARVRLGEVEYRDLLEAL